MREGTCVKRTSGNTGTAPAGLPHPRKADNYADNYIAEIKPQTWSMASDLRRY